MRYPPSRQLKYGVCRGAVLLRWESEVASGDFTSLLGAMVESIPGRSALPMYGTPNLHIEVSP